MENLDRREKNAYWKINYNPTLPVEEEILPEEFNPEIPDGFYGYIIFYGKMPYDIINYYRVYKGGWILSFKDAIKILKEFLKRGVYNYDKEIMHLNITESMVQNGKNADELKELFLSRNNLRDRFQEFVRQCEQGEKIQMQKPVGCILSPDKQQLRYLYERDVVV